MLINQNIQSKRLWNRHISTVCNGKLVQEFVEAKKKKSPFCQVIILLLLLRLFLQVKLLNESTAAPAIS